MIKPIDICFTPLDAPILAGVDISKFLQWVQDVYPQPFKGNTQAIKASEGVLKDAYPWDLTFACHHGNWQPEFIEQFPNIVSYAWQAFQLKKEEICNLVFLPIREQVTGVAFWHTDVDDTGFRFYLVNENYKDNPLMVRRTVEPYNLKERFTYPIDSNDSRLQTDEFICEMPHPLQPFYLNNFRAVHSPIVTNPSVRVAGFITIKDECLVDVKRRTDEWIVNSAKKYSDQAILWNEENRIFIKP